MTRPLQSPGRPLLLAAALCLTSCLAWMPSPSAPWARATGGSYKDGHFFPYGYKKYSPFSAVPGSFDPLAAGPFLKPYNPKGTVIRGNRLLPYSDASLLQAVQYNPNPVSGAIRELYPPKVVGPTVSAVYPFHRPPPPTVDGPTGAHTPMTMFPVSRIVAPAPDPKPTQGILAPEPFHPFGPNYQKSAKYMAGAMPAVWKSADVFKSPPASPPAPPREITGSPLALLEERADFVTPLFRTYPGK